MCCMFCWASSTVFSVERHCHDAGRRRGCCRSSLPCLLLLLLNLAVSCCFLWSLESIQGERVEVAQMLLLPTAVVQVVCQSPRFPLPVPFLAFLFCSVLFCPPDHRITLCAEKQSLQAPLHQCCSTTMCKPSGDFRKRREEKEGAKIRHVDFWSSSQCKQARERDHLLLLQRAFRETGEKVKVKARVKEHLEKKKRKITVNSISDITYASSRRLQYRIQALQQHFSQAVITVAWIGPKSKSSESATEWSCHWMHLSDWMRRIAKTVIALIVTSQALALQISSLVDMIIITRSASTGLKAAAVGERS